MTVLLARNRQPPPTVAAAGAPHAEPAAGLVSLPSGLLAMVCEAIVKLNVRLGACWRAWVHVRVGRTGDGRGPTLVATRALRLSEYGRGSARLERRSGPMLTTSGTTTCGRMLFRLPMWSRE